MEGTFPQHECKDNILVTDLFSDDNLQCENEMKCTKTPLKLQVFSNFCSSSDINRNPTAVILPDKQGFLQID